MTPVSIAPDISFLPRVQTGAEPKLFPGASSTFQTVVYLPTHVINLGQNSAFDYFGDKGEIQLWKEKTIRIQTETRAIRRLQKVPLVKRYLRR